MNNPPGDIIQTQHTTERAKGKEKRRKITIYGCGEFWRGRADT